MKKIRVFIGALFALAVVSCTMEDNFQNVKLEEKEVTIEAIREVDDIETRTYRDDSDGSILWVPGDAISLFYGSGSNGGSKFTSVNTTDTTKVTNFTGVITAITGGGEVAVDQTYFWGLYPYQEDASCDGTSVTMNLPKEQTAVPGTFATNTFPSLGRSQGLIMGFYNICSGMKFSVTKEGIKKVTLKSKGGEKISGKAKVSFKDGIPVAEIIDGSDEVVLEAPAGEYFEPGKYYFLVMFPTKFTNGFTVTLETFTEEATVEKTGTINAKRSNFGKIANIDTGATYSKKTGNIPVEDANFKAYLVENFDGNGDGEISYEEAGSVDKIDLNYNWEAIKTLNGIEYFENLDTLKYATASANSSFYWVDEKNGETLEDVVNQMIDAGNSSYNNHPRGLVDELDLSNNKKLRYLYLWGHPMMQGINLMHNTELTYINCFASMQTGVSLDVTGNTKLQTLICDACYLQGVLDLSKCINLSYVNVSRNNFSDIVLGSLPNLETISLSSLYLRTIDFSSTPNLKTISISYSQYLERIDASGCPELRRLTCRAPLDTGGDNRTGYIPYGNMKSLDLSNNPKLEYLDCSGCNLKGTLDLTDCPNLTDVIAYYNDIDELRLGNHPQLRKLYLAGCWHLTELNLTGCPALEWISTYACDQLAPVDYSPCLSLTTCYAPVAGSNLSKNQGLKFIEGGTEFYGQLQFLTGLEEIRTGNFLELDLSYNTNIKRVTIWNTEEGATVNLTNLANLEFLDIASYANIEVLDISRNLKLTSFTTNSCPNLKTLYVASSQNIEGITVNRSDEKIHPDTEIIVRPDDGGGEGTGEDDWGNGN